MLYAVTLRWITSPERLEPWREGHKTWLVEGLQQGMVIVAGPLSDNSGGFILMQAQDEKQIEAYLQRDPFIINALVSVERVAVEPGLRSLDFPAQWAAAAKAV
jgi:uncharacterized protein YciI